MIADPGRRTALVLASQLRDAGIEDTTRRKAMKEIEWARLKAHELRELAQRDAVVIVPVASLEQHGPHLPVQVDTLLCTEVARRTARLVTSRIPIVVTPP